MAGLHARGSPAMPIVILLLLAFVLLYLFSSVKIVRRTGVLRT